MNMRAQNNTEKADLVSGIADKALTEEAMKHPCRAPIRRRPGGTRQTQLFCECGQRAVILRATAKVCQRCADLNSAGEPQKVVGRRERHDNHVGWLEIKAACCAALLARGIDPWGTMA